MRSRLTSRGDRAEVTRAVIAIAALYPISVAALLVVLPIVAPRSGPFALAAVLSMHLALAAAPLVPFAAVRGARSLRVGLLVLAVVSVARFGGEWVSIRAGATVDPATELSILSWNLEFGARAGEAAIDGLRGVDADVIVLQELGPEHAAAIEADADLTRRYPYRELVPRPGVFGMHVEVGLGPGWTWRPSRFEGFGVGLLRIDLALAGPGARPIAIDERCDLPGDHCQLAARFELVAP